MQNSLLSHCEGKARSNLKRIAAGFALAMTGLLFLFSVSCTQKRQEKLLDAGEEALSANKYQESAELFRKVIAINPDSSLATKAMYKLGHTQETYLKDYEEALFSYQEFIRHSQDPVSVYEVQKRIAGIYFDNLSDPEKSITAYKKLLELNPQSLEADLFQLKIAQSFFRTNNFEQARIEYQTIVDKFPKSSNVARARFEIGNSYYMEGKYEMGIEALKQVMRNHAQSEFSVEAEFLLAQCYEQAGKLKEALQTYDNLEGRYQSKDILAFRKEELKKRMKKK